jgi:hypothetical protein
MTSLRQTFAKPTSEMPYFFASFAIGVAQTSSYSEFLSQNS